MEITVNSEEIQDFKSRLQTIRMDAALNVVTEWEEKAKTKGISEELRNYLKERLVSTMIDGGKATDMTVLLKLQGRANEIRDLLGLFPV